MNDEATLYHPGSAGQYDYVQLFVTGSEELATYGPKALEAVNPEGLLWMCYPKGSSKIKTDLHRDKGWDLLTSAGFEGIAMISIDDTWSAMRFRPASLVKSSGSRRRTAYLNESHQQVPANAASLEAPDDLQRALLDAPDAARFFEGLAPSYKKGFITWVTEAKRPETRQMRIVKTIEKLRAGLKTPSAKV